MTSEFGKSCCFCVVVSIAVKFLALSFVRCTCLQTEKRLASYFLSVPPISCLSLCLSFSPPWLSISVCLSCPFVVHVCRMKNTQLLSFVVHVCRLKHSQLHSFIVLVCRLKHTRLHSLFLSLPLSLPLPLPVSVCLPRWSVSPCLSLPLSLSLFLSLSAMIICLCLSFPLSLSVSRALPTPPVFICWVFVVLRVVQQQRCTSSTWFTLATASPVSGNLWRDGKDGRYLLLNRPTQTNIYVRCPVMSGWVQPSKLKSTLFRPSTSQVKQFWMLDMRCKVKNNIHRRIRVSGHVACSNR